MIKFRENLEQLNYLLSQFIQKENQPKTIFDITGFKHYENVMSNVYAFFFNDTEEHNFGRLFIDSLFELLQKSINIEGDVFVTREYTTKKGRIDIVLSSKDLNDSTQSLESKDDWVILIENKIWHSLDNDLNDYWNSFKETTKGNKIGIVLSIEDLSESDKSKNPNFVFITHTKLMDVILKNLNNHFLKSHEKHLMLLKDFASNLKSFDKIIINRADMDKDLELYAKDKNYMLLESILTKEKELFEHIDESIINILNKTYFNEVVGIFSKKGRNFDGMKGTIYEQFRIWINYYHIFNERKIYIHFCLHSLESNKVHINAKLDNNSNDFIDSKSTFINQYKSIFNKEIIIDDFSNFSNTIKSDLIEALFISNEIDEVGFHPLNPILESYAIRYMDAKRFIEAQDK